MNILLRASLIPISLACWLTGLPAAMFSQPAGCVQGGGIRFFLDAYLASVGACDCQRAGVFINSYPACNTNPYTLEFEDNFDGDSLDLSKWRLASSIQGALHGSQHIELWTLKNVSVKDGTCHITARKETVVSRAVNYRPDNDILEDGLPNLRTYEYTSSLIKTTRAFLHGKYEIRCRMPEGNGFWPAFWLYGGTRYNEIDIFDNYAGTREVVSSVFHDFDGDGKPTGCNASAKGFDLSQWHTFTCVFDADQILFMVDGRPTWTVPRVITSNKEPVACHDNTDAGAYFELQSYPLEAMPIILDMALISKKGPGGSVPVDDSTPFPSSFDIDYVRMWKRAPDHFELYPNPTSSIVTVKSTHSGIQTVAVSTLNGVLIYKQNIHSIQTSINLQSLPDGIYVVSLGYDGGISRRKIVKITN